MSVGEGEGGNLAHLSPCFAMNTRFCGFVLAGGFQKYDSTSPLSRTDQSFTTTLWVMCRLGLNGNKPLRSARRRFQWYSALAPTFCRDVGWQKRRQRYSSGRCLTTSIEEDRRSTFPSLTLQLPPGARRELWEMKSFPPRERRKLEGPANHATQTASRAKAGVLRSRHGNAAHRIVSSRDRRFVLTTAVLIGEPAWEGNGVSCDGRGGFLGRR